VSLRPRSGGRAAAVLAVVLLSALTGCRRQPAHAGPVVLITFDSLRADVVGGIGGQRGLMPHLEALAQEADWAGRGIAASSWSVPTMASLFTGLSPWQHQAITAGQAELAAELTTLPEALAARGYTTAGFWTGHWYSDKLGYARGFTSYVNLGRGQRAAESLATLSGGRQFVWIHLPEPQAPYLRRDAFLPRLGADVPQVLPRRITPEQLEPFLDPARPLPPGRSRRLWAMYRLNAAWADQRLGRLLNALRQSGQWDRTLLLVTSNQGEELGEDGQVLHGNDLARPVLEVPLVIKLPQGFARRIAEARETRVATARLWSTLVEAVGGAPPPAAAPSLFRRDRNPILSELYLGNGVNLFSLLDGSDQLLFASRFAPPEPGYFRALVDAGRPQAVWPPGESPDEVFDRLTAAFDNAPPLTGIGAPWSALAHWDAEESHPVDDPARQQAMVQRLRAAWRRFVPDELTPEEERSARAPVSQPLPRGGRTG
jgi:sulfatase-like protein